MGKRGPAPQPTALKKKRGNPGKRALNTEEPVFESAENIQPPSVLGEHGRTEFYRVSAQLLENGMFTLVDIPALTVYCQAWERFIEAKEFLKDNGLYYKKEQENGVITYAEFPHVQISNRAGVMIDKIAAKFGFTPADRSRLKAQRPGEEARETVFD